MNSSLLSNVTLSREKGGRENPVGVHEAGTQFHDTRTEITFQAHLKCRFPGKILPKSRHTWGVYHFKPYTIPGHESHVIYMGTYSFIYVEFIFCVMTKSNFFSMIYKLLEFGRKMQDLSADLNEKVMKAINGFPGKIYS